MLDLTLLEERQVFGNEQLDTLKKYGTKCVITDFAILLGGYVSNYHTTDEGQQLNNRTGGWWTKSDDGDYDTLYAVSFSGSRGHYFVNSRMGGARPALHYSSIQSITSNGVRDANGIKEIEYGEYPQWVVDKDYSLELERAYYSGNIRTTGKSYTTDSVRYDQYDTPFRARIYTEYEYNGRKYIRLESYYIDSEKVLSDGRIIEEDRTYWIKVEPIIWLVDEEADIALSKYIILSGIQFDDKEYKGDFENTFIKKFMDEYLSKDIECGVYKEKLIENKQVDIDSIFEDAIKKMNEINEVEKTKKLSLK